VDHSAREELRTFSRIASSTGVLEVVEAILYGVEVEKRRRPGNASLVRANIGDPYCTV